MPKRNNEAQEAQSSPTEGKASRQKKSARKEKPKPKITIVFNGKSYSDEEWKAYCETGEPARITWDYFESDACPPHRKAAWNQFWESVISATIAEINEEERQK